MSRGALTRYQVVNHTSNVASHTVASRGLLNMSSTRTLPSNASATYGCYLGLLIASITLLYAVSLLLGNNDEMMVYKAAVIIFGVVQGTCCLFALQGSRPAWSFALAVNGTMTVVFLFGAPRMRDALQRAEWVAERLNEVPLILGFIPALAFAATTTFLAMSSEEY